MHFLHCKMGTTGYWGRLHSAYEVERWQPHIEKLLRGEVKPRLHVQFTLKEVQQDIDEADSVCGQPLPAKRTGRENSTAPVHNVHFVKYDGPVVKS